MQVVSQRTGKVCHDRNDPPAIPVYSPSAGAAASCNEFETRKKSNYDSLKETRRWRRGGGGGRRRPDSPLTVKLRQKRRVLLFMWTLWFAYMSLMSDEVEAATPPRLLAPAPGYRSTNRGHNNYREPPPQPPPLDEEDREPYASLYWRASRSFSVPRNSKFVPKEGTITTTTKGVPRNSRGGISIDKQNGAAGAGRPLLKASLSNNDDDYYDDGYDLVSGFNCTPPAILDFPPDLFTQAERRAGAVAIHFIASMYIFYAIAVVCDDYFVPAIEAICGELKMPSDVAGATFMAIATSAPELFTNVIGTFITEGDIGIGTIVGSAVFNILAVCACCGFAAKMALPLDWYPLTRDCIFYLFSVILLLVMLNDEKIFWYEALILVLVYGVYILVMWKNSALKKGADGLAAKFGYRPKERFSYKDISDSSDTETSFDGGEENTEKTPLLSGSSDPVPRRRASEEVGGGGGQGDGEKRNHPHHHHHPDDEFVSREDYDEMLIAKALHRQQEDAEEEEGEGGLCRLPRGESCGVWLEWIVGWPARLAFTLTIPDCRTARYRRWYPLTFVMCIVYIAILSYVVSWLMTVIGHTFRIPDSVMGLTFIAAGTSVPEAVSSIIVARQGLGSMGISNSIGSNTFDILMCLGLPWLIRSAILAAGTEVNFIQINSEGLEYSVVILLVSLLLFYLLLACNKFYLDKKVAAISLLTYLLFLVLSSLFELNVFFPVNLPACRISGSF